MVQCSDTGNELGVKSFLNVHTQLRPNENISVFWVTGLKILGRVGTHLFFLNIFFSGKNIVLRILKGFLPFKMHKIIHLFLQKTGKNLGFSSKFRWSFYYMFCFGSIDPENY